MVDRPEPLSFERHKHLLLQTSAARARMKQAQAVPLFLSEAITVSRDLPVVFTTDDPPDLVAICGSKEGGELVVGDGDQLRVSYIPALVRRYPFALGKGNEEDERVVVIDPDAPELSQTEGDALFDDDGNRTPALQERLRLLAALDQERQREAPLLRGLGESGALVSRELTVGEGEGQQTLARGFRVVDRDRLDALDDATLADWARKGLMGALEAHLASLKHLERLAARALEREDAASA